MGDRLHRCVGAGVLTVGMSAFVLAGSAMAYADTETVSSTSTESSDTKSKEAAAEKDSPKTDPESTDKSTDKPAETEPDTDADAETPQEADDTSVEVTDDKNESSKHSQDKTVEEKATKEEVKQDVKEEAEPADVVESSVDDTKPQERVSTSQLSAESAAPDGDATAKEDATEDATEPEATETDVATLSAASAATATATAARPTGPTIVNVIGSLVFGLLDLVVRIFEGPPAVPAGSTVRVGRSQLEIDCGDGYTVDADWYYPTAGEPQGLILFQHGFPARAGLYNGTAADLAERTKSIVVAPSISSNIFACDACNLTGEQMHAAVARLFLDDRTALLASAQQALGITDLPRKFVLVGHSGGAQLVAGAGGFYELYGGTDLAGVILLDGAEVGVTKLARDIGRIPLDIPVYNISAEPGSLNNYGSMSTVFSTIRPGLFSGVQLVGGTHSDTFQTVNPLAQFVVYLLTGFPKDGNVEGAQLLMSGWIDDMFAGTREHGTYGAPGELIDIPASSGHPQAYVLPAPTYTLSFFDQISRWFTEALGLIDVDYCAAPVPTGPVATASAAQQCAAV